MYLGQMKEACEMFAAAISKVLDVDVMIVDQSLNRVANTFRYPHNPIPIRRMSIIGKVITSGELLTIDDRSNYFVCKNCPDIDECEITGLIGVPIFFHKQVIGAIALIVPNRNTNSLYKNFRNSKDFLEKMADLLASKVQNIYDYEKLNLVKKEREIVMDSMEDAILSVDELGYITYHNKIFSNYFHVETSLAGSNFLSELEHPLMKECFYSRSNLSNKLIYAEYQGKSFYGLLSATSMVINGEFRGMLFLFKSLNKLNYTFNVLTTKTSASFGEFSQTASDKMKRAVAAAKKLAVSDEIIIIQSEGNCGEEILAQSIHRFSSRSEHCFIKVDCTCPAISMLENEIFGNENALDMSGSMGKILLSHKGTLYFHEINELSLYLQKRITNFIKTKKIGQNHLSDIDIDTRMIFFTKVPLLNLLDSGKLDEEFYYWLGANILLVPSLRDRKSDLPKLIETNLAFFANQLGLPVPTLDSALMDALCAYDWPNNLKELEQVAEQIVLRSNGGTVKLEDASYLSFCLTQKAVKSMDDVEREHIASMLAQKKNKEQIAKLLNISRGTLYRKIKKYNLGEEK